MPKKSKDRIREVLEEVTKTFGAKTIFSMGPDERGEKVPSIKTGFTLLDEALGVGGIPKGRITEIFGPEASGKTTLGLKAIAAVQREDGVAAFIDAEHSLDPRYAREMGVNL